ncbi:short-chain fatty acyl-CoA regulator family protein [Algicella marina]|uniref:Helix-turn-helix domain-containing protein n=1 Tax=Algicella marina TaxID=2683284 RepID=A0A6P1T698_9RHOB|nr:short-chain fatty acyl-CoA regulator family protein [Algicella marina]QHQ36789.1 helix-turn-helix domain-containing protein [Algicella marina]
MSQTALAHAVGISPSYLNLIEHNKRSIGGQILNAIAEALETRSSALAEGGNPGLLTELQETVSASSQTLEPPEDLAARFPVWAEHVTELTRRIRDQEAVITALSDRLTHDPFLSETVHGILSNVTAIRSTAAILTQVDTIPEDQRKSFYANLHAESIRLSATAEDLADYLARAGSGVAGAATAEEAVDQFLTRNAFTFEALDEAAEALTEKNATTAAAELDVAISAMMVEEPGLTDISHDLAVSFLRTYAVDAHTMPLQVFAAAAAECAYDPLSLSMRFNAPLHAVFRRLACLRRTWIGAPRFGLLTVSASGYPLFRQPLPGFAMPRHGNACPLWPIFAAFAQTGQVQASTIAHDNGQTFVAITHASPRPSSTLGGPGDLISSMLLVSAENNPFGTLPASSRSVGTACRICTRTNCQSRISAQLIKA